ncbi:MAG: transglutaminase TgpA family protein, partial [Candidatus Limnocylindria bacterium]
MPDWLRRYARPREGWIAYFLLFVMLLSLGWAVQKAGWLKQEDFLVPVALWASLLGTVLGLSGLSVLTTLPIAALAGTGVVLWTVGGEYFTTLSQGARLLALRSDAIEWTRAVSHFGYPNSLSPYAIGLAGIMWVTAFIAAYTLYRHHRVLDAILLVGAALIANMSATFIDLFGYLVLFVLAALLLWLRGALINREDGWRRRRVNENVEVPASIMRTGVVFIAVSITLSWMLTTVAVAAPLTDAWRNLDGVWTGVRDRLDGFFGGLTNAESRFSGSTFGSQFKVNGSWISNNSPVMTVASDKPYYMRTTTYDQYTGHGWAQSDSKDTSVAINAVIFPKGTPEQPATKEGFTVEQVTVKLDKPAGRNLFTPGFPLKVSAPSKVTLPRGLPFIGALSSQNGIDAGQGYSVTAVISNVTEAQLREAGLAYPDSVKQLYLGRDGITSRTAGLASQIVTEARATNPYDMAKTLASWLRTQPEFRYSTDVGQPPQDQDLVDFFLFDSKAGYCQYYASAMVMMARSLGIPARVAVGFSPGQLLGKGLYQYRESNAHAWAEVYFPGYGWQVFEATKSIDPKFSRAAGVAGQDTLPPPINAQEGGLGPFQESVDQPSKISTIPSTPPLNGGTIAGGPDAAAGAGDARGGSLLVIFAILLAVAAAIWWRLRRTGRRLRFLAPGDKQWALLLQAADRAGVSQRPSETDYEYAGWLEEQIPARRPEIRTIADAKVRGSYSGRGMTSDAIERMQGARQRLRLPLVWLAMRRRVR